MIGIPWRTLREQRRVSQGYPEEKNTHYASAWDMNPVHLVEDSQGTQQPELTCCFTEQAFLCVDVPSFTVNLHSADKNLDDPGKAVEKRQEVEMRNEC